MVVTLYRAWKKKERQVTSKMMIDILREQIADLKEQSELIKYSKKCKNCGCYNDKEDEFCLDCGATLYPYHKTVYSVRFPDEEEKK